MTNIDNEDSLGEPTQFTPGTWSEYAPPILLYKFLRTGLKSEHGYFQWKIGQWEKIDQPLEICSVGFHGSQRAVDALSYVPGEIIALTEVRGDWIKEDNKQAWSEMRIIKAWHWTKKDSVLLAIFAAENVIGVYESKYPNDDRPRKAIEAAKAYLENPCSDTADAARAAADAAHPAAARAVFAGASYYAADAAHPAAVRAVFAVRAAARAANAARAAACASDAAACATPTYTVSDAACAACASRAAACASDAAALDKIESWLRQHIEILEPWSEQK